MDRIWAHAQTVMIQTHRLASTAPSPSRESRHLRTRSRADPARRDRLIPRMAPLDSVLDIDGNRHVFDELRELVATSRAVSFVGAGASADLSIRSGRSWSTC